MKIKCKCLECNEVVFIPEEQLDTTTRVPQWARCPECNYKMKRIKIIQE